MTTSEPDREATAFLAMARRLCSALTEREQLIRLFREPYDRSEEDPRTTPEKRAKIAGEFVRATHIGRRATSESTWLKLHPRPSTEKVLGLGRPGTFHFPSLRASAPTAFDPKCRP